MIGHRETSIVHWSFTVRQTGAQRPSAWQIPEMPTRVSHACGVPVDTQVGQQRAGEPEHLAPEGQLFAVALQFW